MPLTLAEEGVTYSIVKICGDIEHRHHIEAMGFVEGCSICILSRYQDYYIVLVKGSRIGIDKEVAKKIIVC